MLLVMLSSSLYCSLVLGCISIASLPLSILEASKLYRAGGESRLALLDRVCTPPLPLESVTPESLFTRIPTVS